MYFSLKSLCSPKYWIILSSQKCSSPFDAFGQQIAYFPIVFYYIFRMIIINITAMIWHTIPIILNFLLLLASNMSFFELFKLQKTDINWKVRNPIYNTLYIFIPNIYHILKLYFSFLNQIQYTFHRVFHLQ